MNESEEVESGPSVEAVALTRVTRGWLLGQFHHSRHAEMKATLAREGVDGFILLLAPLTKERKKEVAAIAWGPSCGIKDPAEARAIPIGPLGIIFRPFAYSREVGSGEKRFSPKIIPMLARS